MAHITRRGERWFAQLEVKGQRSAKSFDTKAEAREWSKETERLLRGGSHATRTVRDVFERYAEKESPRKKSGVGEARRLLFYCRDPIATVPLYAVNASHFSAWRDRRVEQVSDSTVRRDMNTISSAFTTAVNEWKWLAENPLHKVRRPADHPPRFRRVSEDEIAKINFCAGYTPGTPPESATARTAAAFTLACRSAMRSGEIMNLIREHVHISHKPPWLHIPKGKTAAAKRDVPLILVGAVNVLRDVLALGLDPVFGLTPGRRDALWRKLMQRAGISDLHFHDSDHEGISRYAKLYPDVMRLAKVVGRTDLKVLLTVYYNPTIEELGRV